MYAFVIEPATYIAFADEAEQIGKCKEWDLLSEKATKTKVFYYKGNGLKEACSLVGYADHMTAVIEFANKQKHCIHYAYLKEMQAASFGQRYESAASPDEASAGHDLPASAAAAAVYAPEAEAAPSVPSVSAPADHAADPAAAADRPASAEPPVKARASAGKSKKAQLPEEKVKLTAVIQEFTTVPNHFADNDDEVIIYESVVIADTGTELGEAWSSHSATLKKLELAVGDKLSFEAKLVAKKLAKHPIPYKINNPAKIVKE
ncbi:hypothetical protein VQ071_00560 [Cohnella sp. 56]|uniref:hypothetical protein n=1 Tax=Cohnella sp. 56 TaxID=3113722 RepID=UPI0030EABD20